VIRRRPSGGYNAAMASKLQFSAKNALVALGAFALWCGLVAWLRIPWDDIAFSMLFTTLGGALGMAISAKVRGNPPANLMQSIYMLIAMNLMLTLMFVLTGFFRDR
jgi:hypothetical protein